MHIRMHVLVGDPARLSAAARYLEATVRPHVEEQPGNMGLSVLTNAELGACVVGSYWDTPAAMAASEHAIEVPRKELAEMIRGTVMVEHYEVAVLRQHSRPHPGAGFRFTRVDCDPADVGAAIEEYRSTAVSALMEMPGLLSTQFLADRGSGHCIAVTAWEDRAALAANRSAAAVLQADVAAVTHAQVPMVAEYTLAFSSVRDREPLSIIERNVQLWNTRDRDGWLAQADLQRLEVVAPGGLHLFGREGGETAWAMWHDAFPGNRLETVTIHADAKGGLYEGRFIGAHTGRLRGPDGEIPPTGRPVDAQFCTVYECTDGKITSLHLYFDQADLIRQLGLGDAAGGR